MMSKEFPLTPYMALDLTDEKGVLCGKILSDLGVEVIKIERPGGDPSRSIGPFYHDIPHPERSLSWFAFNTGKRGVTLDIGTSHGRDIFLRLVSQADFVVESFVPGTMKAMGLGFEDLEKVNPRIILTSISPFGQDGPYADYKGPDLIVWALGGMLYLCGDEESTPVRISFPQSYAHAGAAAAAATLITHHAREKSGKGQHVDVSAQQCVEWATAEIAQIWEMTRRKVGRTGQFRVRPSTGARLRELWPCKDGFVCFRIMGGKAGASFMRALVQWMEGEGMADDYLLSRDWNALDLGTVSQEDYDRAERPVGRFFMAYTKDELYTEATRRRIQLFPVSTSQDVVKDPQLEERGFWQDLAHPELGETIRYAGPFARFSVCDCGPRQRAPLIGEHNEDVFGKRLGLSRRDLVVLKESKVL